MPIKEIFGNGGVLSDIIPNYVPRPGQVAMAEAIHSHIKDGIHLLAEGPTGTGKSMAYGIPAALYALETGKTVVIATANIPLQEQLIKKDLPLIAEALDGVLTNEDEKPFPRLTFKLMKGFSNYLCKRELYDLLSKRPPKWAEVLADWESQTETGDKSEAPAKELASSLKGEPIDVVWREVSTNADECTRRECKFHDECYVFNARLGGADIVVTNYHMLYQDFVVREATMGEGGILPVFDVVVMDEAHEAVDIAMDFHGFDLTERKISWALRGLRALRSEAGDRTVRTILSAAEGFFKEVTDTKDRFDSGIIDQPLGFGNGLLSALDHGVNLIERAIETEDRPKEKKARLKLQARMLANTAYQVETVCKGVAEDDGSRALPEGNVYFISQEWNPRPTTHIKCKTVEVQGFLRRHVFNHKTMIGTSATLTTDGNFKFIAKELGLVPGEYGESIAPNPFDSDRVIFVTPEEVPEPDYRNRDAHMEAVAMAIVEIARDLDGKTLGLFTTHKALKHAAKVLRKELRGMNILVQGELYDRTSLVNEFKKGERSILLGTASFWQGVDVPGDALSCLVIDKIPFIPPNDPVMRYMERKFEISTGSGRAAFMKYSVPKAVIALKQGMGRLIRTEKDYGALVLCDSRFQSKGYCETIMSAVPDKCWESDTLRDVMRFMRRFQDG